MGFRISFLPEGKTIELDEPLDLALAAARCDLWLEHPCGGSADCGRCRVRVARGIVPPTAADRLVLDAGALAAGWRLGCRLVLDGPCEIELPPRDASSVSKSFGPQSLPRESIEPQVPPGLIPPAGVPIGAAVDLGSTTLAAALVDLRDGGIIVAGSCLNPQARFGADIMSRIHFAQTHEHGNAALRDAVRGAVGGMIGDLIARAGLAAADVVSVTCVGNATMTHSAVGADVRPLGEAPYLGLFAAEQEAAAAALGWPVHPQARVRFAPMVRSHVGGDTVAGILACGIGRLDGWRLLIDLGTNAEVVVGSLARLVAASTAAGPAFEGAGITCGMRAAPGAIGAVRAGRDGRLSVSTLDDRPAVGICGSGLIDAVAELLRAGVIAPSGYMRNAAECEAHGVPGALRSRLARLPTGERAVRLAGDVVLTAGDVRQLQLAKGSLAAGIDLLLKRLELPASALAEILVAGTFGSFVRKESLLGIGAVPALDPQRVRFVGDAAGAGARLMLVDGASRRRAMEIAARCEFAELGGDPGYEDTFAARLAFPSP